MKSLRAGLLVAALALAVVGSAAAAGGNDKITICHATSSLSNPYVEITISTNAWSPDDPSAKHGPHHHREKQGVEWQDYILEDGECTLDQEPPDDPTDEPTDDPTDEPTDDPTDEPTDDPTDCQCG